jgi:hypothetical protein
MNTRKQAYDQLRKLVSNRVARALDMTDKELDGLSLAQLINMLFLLHGDGGSTGNFSVTFGTVMELIGADLLWHDPETVSTAVQ